MRVFRGMALVAQRFCGLRLGIEIVALYSLRAVVFMASKWELFSSPFASLTLLARQAREISGC